MGFLARLRSGRALHTAVRALQEGRLGEAAALFERYLEAVPGSWEAWSWLGECRQALGDPGGAEEAFRRSLELNPEGVEAAEGLALVYAERDQDWTRSLETLGELLTRCTQAGVPEFTEIDLAWVHHLKGDSEKAKEYFDQALGHMNWEGVEKDGQFAQMEFQVGALYWALRRDRESATQHLQEAMRLSPESVHARQARELVEQLAGD